MKKMVFIAVLGIVSTALVGCGATPLTQNQVSLQNASYTAQAACYARLAAQDAQLNTMLSRIPSDQVALVMMVKSMQDNNKVMMSLATGNDYNPCANGANAFDVQIAEIKEKNASVRRGIDGGGSVLKWGIGGWTASAVVDKIGAKTITSGSSNDVSTNSKNSTATGGESAVSTPVNSSTPSTVEETTTNSLNTTGEAAAEEAVEE